MYVVRYQWRISRRETDDHWKLERKAFDVYKQCKYFYLKFLSGNNSKVVLKYSPSDWRALITHNSNLYHVWSSLSITNFKTRNWRRKLERKACDVYKQSKYFNLKTNIELWDLQCWMNLQGNITTAVLQRMRNILEWNRRFSHWLPNTSYPWIVFNLPVRYNFPRITRKKRIGISKREWRWQP